MTNKRINKYANYAQKALLYEVLLSPKPGLVDRFDSGSHNDMNIYTFVEAIGALTPYFTKYLLLGFHHEGSEKELFNQARIVGQEAEEAMMKATNGVNTHKGANFTFALVLSATGYLLKEKPSDFIFTEEETNKLFQYISKMTAGLASNDFKDLEQKENLSYGEKLFKKYGITGIRGVAENGYPVITNHAMPYLRKNLKEHPNHEEVLLYLLALIMSESEDTNLIHRGGISAYRTVQSEMKEIYERNTPSSIVETFQKYNKILIERHLSPGGAADLLALSIYMAQVENLYP